LLEEATFDADPDTRALAMDAVARVVDIGFSLGI
jgi:hypothetical protein